MEKQNFVFPSASVLLDKMEINKDSKDTLTTTQFSSYQIECEQEMRDKQTVSSSCGVEGEAVDMSSSEWESDQSLERYERKKKQKRKKKKKKKKKKHHHEMKPNTIWIDETTLDYTQAYRKDKHADIQNLHFDGLYKMDIALFTPNIEWQCLGLGKKQKIILYPLKKKKKKKSNSEKFRYFYGINSSNPPQDCHTEERFVHNVESSNFIPVFTNTKQDQRVDEKEHLGGSYLEESKKYSQLLLQNPGNVKLWLEFVDYQDVLASSHVEDDYFKSSPTPKAIIEKKVSILEKAMLKNPTSKTLIIKYAHLIKEIWPSEKVMETWKQWLFKFPNSNLLWREYLRYFQSNLLVMKVSSVLDAYRKCFRMLVGICEETIKSHKAEPNASEELLLVFLQLVIFLWKAGHTEKCLCLLQSLIEFNVCSKSTQFNSLKHKKDSFEEFFNGQTDKFGDDDAISWLSNPAAADLKASVPSNLIRSKPFFQQDFDNLMTRYKQDTAMFKAWSYLEDVRMFTELPPFKGDMDDCEDTERIVLFDDISFALFDLKSDKLLFQLILSYLILLGIPVHSRMIHQRIKDCFSRSFYLRSDVDSFKCLCHHGLCQNFLFVQSVLITDSGEYNEVVVRTARNVMSQALSRLPNEFVNAISEIWLHFESVLFCSEFENMSRDLDKKYWKEVQKFIKTILKLQSNRNCLVLWSMYARYEWNLGNPEESRKICYTALKMCSIETESKRIFNMATCIRAMVDLQLGLSSIDKKLILSPELKSSLLETLIGFVNPDVIVDNTLRSQSPVLLLKVRSTLQANLVWLKQQKTSIEKQCVFDFYCCYVVFEYLFSGIVALQNAFQELLSFDQDLENSTEVSLYVLLFMRAESERNFSSFPSYRKTVELCFAKHHQDANLNYLYMEIKRHGLDSLSARRFYEDILRCANSVDTWLHAITYESKRLQFMTVVPSYDQVSSMQFSDAYTGVHNRIVSLYKRMLEKEEHKYCPVLWIKYISFLLKYCSKEVAKEALYVALRSNPSSKALYMFSCKSFDNFREMYDLMIEKEIRVKLITEELELLWNS